jgi:hypothetical protein
MPHSSQVYRDGWGRRVPGHNTILFERLGMISGSKKYNLKQEQGWGIAYN